MPLTKKEHNNPSVSLKSLPVGSSFLCDNRIGFIVEVSYEGDDYEDVQIKKSYIDYESGTEFYLNGDIISPEQKVTPINVTLTYEI